MRIMHKQFLTHCLETCCDVLTQRMAVAFPLPKACARTCVSLYIVDAVSLES